MIEMKTYIKALILFILTFTIGVMVRYYSQSLTAEPFIDIIFKSFLAVVFILFIYLFGKDKWPFFQSIKWKPHYWNLLFFIIVLFGMNNYFQVIYSENQYYPETIKAALGSYIISYIVSSTSEEIIFRGFIQSFINENTVVNSSVISKGNLFATILFFMIHLGFFTVMDTFFAITSLVNVIIFSLIADYLFDRTKNIFVPVLIHILINMLHIFIQVK